MRTSRLRSRYGYGRSISVLTMLSATMLKPRAAARTSVAVAVSDECPPRLRHAHFTSFHMDSRMCGHREAVPDEFLTSASGSLSPRVRERPPDANVRKLSGARCRALPTMSIGGYAMTTREFLTNVAFILSVMAIGAVLEIAIPCFVAKRDSD